LAMPVLIGMMLGRFTAVVCSMLAVSMRHVGVMTSLLVISTLVMRGGFTMVFSRMIVMFCCFLVMVRAFMFHVGNLCVNLPGFADLRRVKYSVLPVSPRFRFGKFHVTGSGREAEKRDIV